jgi:hypothetical protein
LHDAYAQVNSALDETSPGVSPWNVSMVYVERRLKYSGGVETRAEVRLHACRETVEENGYHWMFLLLQNMRTACILEFPAIKNGVNSEVKDSPGLRFSMY